MSRAGELLGAIGAVVTITVGLIKLAGYRRSNPDASLLDLLKKGPRNGSE